MSGPWKLCERMFPFPKPEIPRYLGVMSQTDVHALTLRLADDEYEQLRTFAFLSHRPITDVIRAAVRDYLAAAGRQDALQAAINMVREDHRKALDVLADR